MSDKNKIKSKLIEALKESCDDALTFSDNETQLIDAEYLITVNTAKKIREINEGFGYPFKIFLEHETGTFTTACTPLFGGSKADNFLGYIHTIRSKLESLRKGKIDIAVYKTSNGIDIPVCCVEVKGFNPSKSEVIKDLVRNVGYFNLTSDTGDSTLRYTFFIALHSYKGLWNDDKETKNIEKVKLKYQGYIAENKILCGFQHDIHVETVRRGFIPSIKEYYTYEIQGDEDYHYIGVVVTSKNIIT